MSVIEVKDVSIGYMTGDFKDIGLKEYVLRRIKRNYYVSRFWADKDINFSLESGDMLGIIGTNGAGKSTLLKVVSGIMEPTRGYVKRNGRVSALLELASGFDGELTVRENTYLRGAMLGYTREFMDNTYKQIISFAELEEFQDRPFKQLSSGMKSRLAFSIASLVNPEILILDEVLAVGDGAFNKKSSDKMREIIESGAATILVSHSIDQVRTMCNKVLWLHKGEQIVFSDDVQGVCDSYAAFLAGDPSQLERFKESDKLSTADGEKTSVGQTHRPVAHVLLPQAIEESVNNNFMIRAFYFLFAVLSASPLVYLKDELQNKQVMLYTITFFVGYAGVIGLYCFIMRKVEPILKRRDWMILLGAVVIGGILVRWAMLSFLQTEPISDFRTPHWFYQYYPSHGPYTAGTPWEQRDFFQLYYAKFPAWFTYMRLIMLIYDLFGENLLWMQIWNMLLAGASIVAIYFAIPTKTTALLASALFAFNPSLIVYSCITTPDHITIFLFIMVVFFGTRLEQNRVNWLHNAKGRIYALATLICCILINLFKPLSILFAVVFICYESAVHLYPALRARLPMKQLWKRVLSGELAFLLALLSGIAISNAALKHSVETMLQTDVVDATGYYLLVGYSVNENGKYDDSVGNQLLSETCEKYANDYTKAFPEIERLAKEQIRQNIPLLPSIWWSKHQIAFGSEYAYFGFSNTSADGEYSASIQRTCQIPFTTAMLAVMRLMYALSALFAVLEISRKKAGKQMLLAAIIVFGYVLVLLLGGVQSRYKSLIVPLWCMISAYALCTPHIQPDITSERKGRK